MAALPQWSPPLIGGSTARSLTDRCPGKQPQWSPPLIGGSTGPVDRVAGPRELAAMEPAVDRREHTHGTDVFVGDSVAAMEPAVDRREHLKDTTCDRRFRPPQWSPPLIGGST